MKNTSFIQRVIEALDARLWKFIRIIHSANHDYPYHDYVEITGTADPGPTIGVYAVGTNNVNAHGDQSKRFVSKRANIWTDDPLTLVWFNDSRNVQIALPLTLMDNLGAPVYWEKVFHANIAAVYYSVQLDGHLWMYFEGVLPEEARDAE